MSYLWSRLYLEVATIQFCIFAYYKGVIIEFLVASNHVAYTDSDGLEKSKRLESSKWCLRIDLTHRY